MASSLKPKTTFDKSREIIRREITHIKYEDRDWMEQLERTIVNKLWDLWISEDN